MTACGDCRHPMNQFIREHRFWLPLKDEEDYEASEFLGLIRMHK